ncbi:hypothetical protein NC653_008922 [Populus alba x Populus x berolinensis]|uniref:Beta-ketoacyl-[acyl-carrier-protein] synthase III C-terminal domain-containing protein n=1 Tax=Populus alba x Populus x berolinensis TaxID=444605 RepID=A0AAD6W928_9ROSI|nr:hypothetical protein NC653_008922 [Populus alba x Populus x berolinensis]
MMPQIVTVDDNRMGPLYKHVFPPIFGSRAILCSSTMEARLNSKMSSAIVLICLRLHQSICASITSPEHMMDDVKAFYSILEASGIPKHYTHKMLDSGKWQVHPGPVVPFSSKPRREDYAFNRGYWIWVLFHQRNLKESGASTIEGSEKISPSQSGLPSEDYGLSSFDLHSDGEGLTFRLPPKRHAIISCLQMNGKEVFRFAVRCVPQSIECALEKAGLPGSSIDWPLIHQDLQANQRIIVAVATYLEVPPENIISNVANYGNTSAASIPLALDEAVRSDQAIPLQLQDLELV